MSPLKSYFLPITQHRFINPLLTLQYSKEAAVVGGLLGSAYLCYSRSTHLNKAVADWQNQIGAISALIKQETVNIGKVQAFLKDFPKTYGQERIFLAAALAKDPACEERASQLANRQTIARAALDSLLKACDNAGKIDDNSPPLAKGTDETDEDLPPLAELIGETDESLYLPPLLDAIKEQVTTIKEEVEHTTALDPTTPSPGGNEIPFGNLMDLATTLNTIALVQDDDPWGGDPNVTNSYLTTIVAKLPDASSSERSAARNVLTRWAWKASDEKITVEENGEEKPVVEWLGEAATKFCADALDPTTEVNKSTKQALQSVKRQLEARLQQPSWGWMDTATCLTPVALSAGYYALSSFATMPVNG